MAKLVFGMNVSLDGFVDHDRMQTGPALFRHWTEHVAGLAGSVYGRRMYELMRYWDTDDPTWDPARHGFALAWRKLPKWVVSSSLEEVGPNATIVSGDAVAVVRSLKADLTGELSVSGPRLAQAMSDARLIDEYRLYVHPAVLGHGTPFFAGAAPALQLVAHDLFGDGVIRLTYRPA